MTGRQQSGVTLVEVLVAMLVMAIGLLGAAALQLNALKHTDSSTIGTQVSFITYDILDRIRANPCSNATLNPCINPGADYQLGSLVVPGTISTIRDQDISDFVTNLNNIPGAGPIVGSIAVAAGVVTITVSWNDTRAANTNTVSTFSLVSQVSTVWNGL
ncbi:type IV pilus modification protein PilV [Pseudomonas gingeri]|uniref:type IV pilus modification protein PilV n=1 Tax=Pseudomonas gingeri TaxID=117681 RepID=UPI0015A4A223|nr:type IV pilus modification protein PilV [Pseudomonas gingeri]NWD09282.1 type IV pilus modification protein PilV [Pseudomonas gingeri]NWE32059.1 type IV pilus modification protein PilV [Pseudomonas gingeri]NWE58723.1 type IV pilus modification protein PilV [Pseudomonas gingeri]NWF01266.1 type IV pilus modification protein PilV [Pseudomonas gingeri]